MQRNEKEELLVLLEEKRRREARGDLNAYCRYIEIPGAPINDDDQCDEFYPDTVTPAKHHELLNNALMRVEAGEIRRLMVFMPPGSAKSTYGTVTFPTWYMGRKRGRRVITTGYGTELALKFSRKCRQITRSNQYRELFDTELTPDNKAVHDWSLTNSSALMAAGILAGITGNRADGIVIDDPIKGREEADSPVIREKIWEEYRTSVRTRLKPNGFITIIQTRWHEDDLSGRILPADWDGQSGWVRARDGEMWYVICLQAECTRDDDPLGRKPGEWLWTEWFTPEHWAQEKITQGSRNWSALFQQVPKPSEGGIFKRAWFRRYRERPVKFDLLVLSIDSANKERELNDPSVASLWGVLAIESRHDYYLLHVWRARVEYPLLKHTVKNLFARDKPDSVLIEDKSSGQSLIQELRDETTIPVVAIEPEGDKVMRAHAVSSVVEAGHVYLPEEAEWLIDWESEIFGFPLSTKKDQVDSMTQFLRWVRTKMTSFNAWGSGQLREGAALSKSHIDIDHGYGTVRSDTDLSGY